MNSLWDNIIWGNSILNWVIAFGIIIVSFAVIKIAKTIVLKRLKKLTEHTSNTLDDFFVMLAETTVFPVLYIAAVYFGISYLTFSPKAEKVMNVAVLLVATYFIVRAVTSALNYLINRAIDVREESIEKKRQARGIIIIVNIVVWVLGIVFLINNLGYNITSVITGLGIGGIAIALASQNILGDLFNYFVIFFDKPFEIGDFIIVDNLMGSVEYIGVKSTRLRALDGEQLICSNTWLTNSRIHNYKRMLTRRIVFKLYIVYDTNVDLITRIPVMIRQIIEAQKNVKFDRAHFSGFDNASLNFEVVYIIQSGDYNIYMDIQQAIYVDILKAFNKEGVRFAYPTQNLMINNPGALIDRQQQIEPGQLGKGSAT
jgi:small-conductance mechanosensitive channel